MERGGRVSYIYGMKKILHGLIVITDTSRFKQLLSCCFDILLAPGWTICKPRSASLYIMYWYCHGRRHMPLVRPAECSGY